MKSTTVWKLKEMCGDISVPLVLAALVAAIFGKGSYRIPLALCAVLGFFLGIPAGIL
jgi:hypothetical protein